MTDLDRGIAGRVCTCGAALTLAIESGGEPWPETGVKFTGYAEHWECERCGFSEIVQVPQ